MALTFNGVCRITLLYISDDQLGNVFSNKSDDRFHQTQPLYDRILPILFTSKFVTDLILWKRKQDVNKFLH